MLHADAYSARYMILCADGYVVRFVSVGTCSSLLALAPDPFHFAAMSTGEAGTDGYASGASDYVVAASRCACVCDDDHVCIGLVVYGIIG